MVFYCWDYIKEQDGIPYSLGLDVNSRGTLYAYTKTYPDRFSSLAGRAKHFKHGYFWTPELIDYHQNSFQSQKIHLKSTQTPTLSDEHLLIFLPADLLF